VVANADQVRAPVEVLFEPPRHMTDEKV
jgi:hypothetical protein